MAAGASSSGPTRDVLNPAASSAAFKGTAVSRSAMVRRIWEGMIALRVARYALRATPERVNQPEEDPRGGAGEHADPPGLPAIAPRRERRDQRAADAPDDEQRGDEPA